jgi:hypothetical protein
MASSLDKLTKGLGKDDFKNLNLMTSHYTRKQQEMLKQKGMSIWMDSTSWKRRTSHPRANSSAVLPAKTSATPIIKEHKTCGTPST